MKYSCILTSHRRFCEVAQTGLHLFHKYNVCEYEDNNHSDTEDDIGTYIATEQNTKSSHNCDPNVTYSS